MTSRWSVIFVYKQKYTNVELWTINNNTIVWSISIHRRLRSILAETNKFPCPLIIFEFLYLITIHLYQICKTDISICMSLFLFGILHTHIFILLTRTIRICVKYVKMIWLRFFIEPYSYPLSWVMSAPGGSKNDLGEQK